MTEPTNTSTNVGRSSEPVTIFAPHGDPQKILAEVQKRYEKVTSDGLDWTWLRVECPEGTLTLLHDRAYYTGPSWDDQRRGMQNFFRRFPGSDDLHRRVENLIGLQGFALGTRFDPDYEDPGEDERFAIISGLTAMLGGILFTPSGLRDAYGDYIISADGSDNDDHRRH